MDKRKKKCTTFFVHPNFFSPYISIWFFFGKKTFITIDSSNFSLNFFRNFNLIQALRFRFHIWWSHFFQRNFVIFFTGRKIEKDMKKKNGKFSYRSTECADLLIIIKIDKYYHRLFLSILVFYFIVVDVADFTIMSYQIKSIFFKLFVHQYEKKTMINK